MPVDYNYDSYTKRLISLDGNFTDKLQMYNAVANALPNGLFDFEMGQILDFPSVSYNMFGGTDFSFNVVVPNTKLSNTGGDVLVDVIPSYSKDEETGAIIGEIQGILGAVPVKNLVNELLTATGIKAKTDEAIDELSYLAMRATYGEEVTRENWRDYKASEIPIILQPSAEPTEGINPLKILFPQNQARDIFAMWNDSTSIYDGVEYTNIGFDNPVPLDVSKIPTMRASSMVRTMISRINMTDWVNWEGLDFAIRLADGLTYNDGNCCFGYVGRTTRVSHSDQISVIVGFISETEHIEDFVALKWIESSSSAYQGGYQLQGIRADGSTNSIVAWHGYGFDLKNKESEVIPHYYSYSSGNPIPITTSFIKNGFRDGHYECHSFLSLCLSESHGQFDETQFEINGTPFEITIPAPQFYPNWKVQEIATLGQSTLEVPNIIELPCFELSAELASTAQALAQEPLAVINPIPSILTALSTVPLNIPQIIDPVINPSDTPIPIVPPIINISSNLGKVYNPNQQQLNDLGAFLWQTDIISQIKSIFQNPLDGIIGLSQIYVTPPTNGSDEIALGSIGTGVSAPVVSKRYIELDLGTVNISEFYGDSRDYTKCNAYIYLPFIGFQDLNIVDVMSAQLHLIYRVDIYTGACIANIYVTKTLQGKTNTAMLYTFQGNCSAEVPLTSADKSRLFKSIATMGVGVVSGNPMLIGSGALSLTSGNAINISHSGSYEANASVMCDKTPFVIISRQVPYNAMGYNAFYGQPSNETVTLSECNGYTRVKEIHVEGIACTTEEKTEIETLLKDGVIF